MIQQVAFEVPVDIALGLASGELVQYGGVVRDTAGHIVKHLKPAGGDANRALEVAANALSLAKQNKKIAIGALAVAGAAAAGGGIYYLVHTKQANDAKAEQKVLLDFFNDALTLYVDELSRGELTLETINHLEAAVDALEANIGDNNYAIEIEGERFKSLMKSIFDYTNRLAKANNFKTPSNVVSFLKKTPTDLASLKDCLVTQREILQNAA